MKKKKKPRAARMNIRVRPSLERDEEKASLTFPQPGPQDCFDPGTPFTARGPKPATTPGVTRVRLFRPNGLPTLNVLSTDAAFSTNATQWFAEFTAVTDSTELPPNGECRLVVEMSNGTVVSQFSVTFSHVPPAPEVTFNATTGADHTLTISGTTENTDDLTVTVDGVGVEPNFADGAFEFDTESTANSTIEVIFRTQNDRGADVYHSFDLAVDQLEPVFDPDPPENSGAGTTLVFEGTVEDEGSGFTDADDLVVTLTGDTEGNIPQSDDFFVEKGFNPLDPKTITYEITIDGAALQPDLYTLKLEAEDVAGNAEDTEKAFAITN